MLFANNKSNYIFLFGKFSFINNLKDQEEIWGVAGLKKSTFFILINLCFGDGSLDNFEWNFGDIL